MRQLHSSCNNYRDKPVARSINTTNIGHIHGTEYTEIEQTAYKHNYKTVCVSEQKSAHTFGKLVCSKSENSISQAGFQDAEL